MSRMPSTWKPYLPILFGLGLLAGLLGWSATPYLPFPTDDELIGKVSWAWCLVTYNGFYCLQLLLIKAVLGGLGLDAYAVWPVYTAGFQFVAAGLLVALAGGLTRSVWPGVAAGLSFLVAPWTQAYFHFGSYAPLTAALGMGMVGSLAGGVWLAQTRERAVWLAVLAGIWGTALCMTAPSAALFIGVTFGVSLFSLGNAGRRLLLIGAAVFCLGVLLCGFFGGKEYCYHLLENRTNNHSLLFQERFGRALVPARGTFVGILLVFEPVALGLAALGAGLGTVWLRRNFAGVQPPPALAAARWLFWIVLAHAVLIDLLPFTKLARSQFVAFPPLILGLVLSAHQLLGRVEPKRLWRAALALLFAAHLVESSFFWSDVRQARLGALASGWIRPGRVCLLQADPHGKFMQKWLARFSPRLISDASAILPGDVLLVGPQGPGSGKSIIYAGVLPDFAFDAWAWGIGEWETAKLPYYAQLPAFLLEEENCQALLLRGEVPDYRQRSLWLTAYRFPQKSFPPKP